jgi:hypothetical protein
MKKKILTNLDITEFEFRLLLENVKLKNRNEKLASGVDFFAITTVVLLMILAVAVTYIP